MEHVEEKVFEKIKQIVSYNTLLAFFLNKQFKIHTNASDFQLEVVIIQGVKLSLSTA